MKLIPRFLLLAAVAMGLCNTACSEDHALGEDASGEAWVDFELTKMKIENRASIKDDGSGSFTEGDIVDLYARSASGEEHLQLTLRNGAWTPKVRRKQLGTGEVTLTAYYPAGPKKEVENYSHAVSADQSSDEGFAASDLLRSSTTLLDGETRASLRFNHAMHRVKISITPENGTTLPEDLQVEVRSKLAGSIDETGTTTVDPAAETQWIKPLKKGEGCWEAILFPQATEEYKSSWIRIKTGTKSAEYKLPEQIGGKPFTHFEGGKQATVNLKFKNNGEGGGESGDGERPEGTFKLSFDANGGSGSIPPVYLKPGETYTMPEGLGVFTKENAVFHGWTDAPDSYLKWAVGSQFTMGDKDVTVYVLWRIIDTNIGGACEEFKGTTQWVYGITPPEKGDWKNVLGWDPVQYGQSAPWVKGSGWYDTDQFNYYLCWAAGACNIIHWWLDQNRKYIERYGYDGPWDYKTDPRSSTIFDYFVEKWPNHGSVAIIGFSWFLSGTPDGHPKGGAFFKEIFENKTMTETVQMAGGIQRKQFNELMTKAFKEHRGITDVEPYMGGQSHEYTIWGAEYDDEGYICAYYYTNSNDGRTYFADKFDGKRKSIGMLRGEIVYIDGITHVKGIGSNIPITALETYLLGTEYWEEYFEKHPEKR